jgi:hypothetical protein
MKSYRVVPLKTGFFTARLDEAKLEALLNENARAGWTLKTTVKDETRGMIPGSKREAVFLIFEREA